MMMAHGPGAGPAQRCLLAGARPPTDAQAWRLRGAEMVAAAARKVGRIARMWPGQGRQAPGMPRTEHLDTHTDPITGPSSSDDAAASADGDAKALP